MIFEVRLVCIDEDVAVAISIDSTGNRHLLVPAVLSAHWVRLDGKNQVLMNTCILPVNAGRVGVSACERTHAMYLAHHPLARFDLLQLHYCG